MIEIPKDFKKYKVSHALASALSTIKQELYTKYLSETEKSFIYFNNFQLDKNTTIEAATLTPIEDRKSLIKVLFTFNGVMGAVEVDIDFKNPQENLSSMMNDTIKKRNITQIVPNIKEMQQFISNVFIYLNSGNPDMRTLKEHPLPKSEYKDLRQFSKDPSDFILVGMNFKKPPLWSATQTKVSGHFRWQPCGPGLSKVKLIFIDPYVKIFKNEVTI